MAAFANPGYAPLAMTIQEAAAYVGMSVSFLRNEMYANRLPYKKIGKRISVPREDLEAWYNSLKSGPTVADR